MTNYWQKQKEKALERKKGYLASQQEIGGMPQIFG